ncbi:glycoside hydrolase family 16 protein [Daldinia decipiens]|uniref:glycoside hydrolase family 16 protein n=1 Tax=Daldinia decipiens TaxID=326647 RepID=UPI0020C25760|nr:glycoside hydrolase family 16 protein [Daldinia decipiens]KAI1655894.1 glycoside hydrolase family 16 protein [Daldinia decipiens]
MPAKSHLMLAAALFSSVFVSPVAAQLQTDCDPLKKTCPPDPALGTMHLFNFNATPPEHTFNLTAGTVDYNVDTGAAFTMRKKGESVTLISNFYFFFGKTEVFLKAASGTGVISSIVWSSDVLDEVDWEFKGGNATHAFSNYFGKGMPDWKNGGDHLVEGGVLDDYHNYTCVWTKDKLEWWLDGGLLRTLLPKDANNTLNYPQTPMKLSLGIWAGGDPDGPQGTIDWAGGVTDYSQPHTMYVKSALVEDYSSGKEYSYSDQSGSWQSIKIASGNSTAFENINKEPEKSLSEKWNDLPSGTKSGVYAASGGVGAILLVALIFYYFKQRRRGQQEAALAAQRLEQDRVELEMYKKEGRDPDALAFDGTEYNSKSGMASTTYGLSDSPPGSSAGPPQKTWDPTGSSGAAAMPLLRDDTMSTYRDSPGSGPTPQIPAPTSTPPINRSFSSSSNAPGRMGSPGPQANAYGAYGGAR